MNPADDARDPRTERPAQPAAAHDEPSRAVRPDAAPNWLRQLVTRRAAIPAAYRRGVPAEVLAMITAARTAATASGRRRDAAVLVLFCGPQDSPAAALPDDADLLVTMRAATLRHHAGQAAFPGGAADPGDTGPVHTALREAREETGIDTGRLTPLATLDTLFVPPSGFQVTPVLAYARDPGPVAVIDRAETAVVARVPVRAFVDPGNRLMVYRPGSSRRLAGPAFLLEEMLVWGFTGQVVAALLDVAGWSRPWDTGDVRALDEAMAQVGEPTASVRADRYGEVQP